MALLFRELCLQPGLDDLLCEPGTKHPFAHAENVCVVMFSLILAEYVSWQRAARMPLTLLADMAIPCPVPQIRMPLS
jgi:hypothetical protein